MVQAPSSPPPADNWPALQTLSDRDFAVFQRIIYQTAGIHLASVKKALLTGRLAKRLRTLGLNSYRAYLVRLEADDSGAELQELLNLITTNETRFFREEKQFSFLTSSVFPRWRRDASRGDRSRRVRVWCAACSSGQEPYSIAMALLQHLPAGEGWHHEVLASDISTRVLASAEQGVYELERSKEIPTTLLKRFMLKGTGPQTGQMAAGQALRSIIRFKRINLTQSPYPVGGPFDLILCRNVFIYFDQESRQKVAQRLAAELGPKGYFFVGHAESLTNICASLQSEGPTMYSARSRKPS